MCVSSSFYHILSLNSALCEKKIGNFCSVQWPNHFGSSALSVFFAFISIRCVSFCRISWHSHDCCNFSTVAAAITSQMENECTRIKLGRKIHLRDVYMATAINSIWNACFTRIIRYIISVLAYAKKHQLHTHRHYNDIFWQISLHFVCTQRITHKTEFYNIFISQAARVLDFLFAFCVLRI